MKISVTFKGNSVAEILDEIEREFGVSITRGVSANDAKSFTNDFLRTLSKVERTVDTTETMINTVDQKLSTVDFKPSVAHVSVNEPENHLNTFPDVNGPIQWIKAHREKYPTVSLKESKDAWDKLPSNHPDVIRIRKFVPHMNMSSREYSSLFDAFGNRR